MTPGTRDFLSVTPINRLTMGALMQTRRFGRKITLPATMAIKHQIRMLMAQNETKKTEAAEAGAEGFPGHPSAAVPSAVPATEIKC
jgi:hypothetical protein